MIEPGIHPVPKGHIAMVITYLEMTARPPARTAPCPEGYRLAHWPDPPLEDYRALMRRIGTDWLWHGRLMKSDADLAATIHGPDVDIWCLFDGDTPVGLAELKFGEGAQGDECNLAFFGVAPQLIGTTGARHLMSDAIDRAWAKDIIRFDVYTCSLDSPKALDFYRRSGFVEYDRAVEVGPDPRLTGILPREAAPNIAILE